VGFRFPFIFYDIHLSLQLFPANNLFTCFSWIYSLERESGFYFNMRFFEDLVLNDGFDEAEEYLYGFTDVHDNQRRSCVQARLGYSPVKLLFFFFFFFFNFIGNFFFLIALYLVQS
jgi:hypothetical protein